jgi:uncharacterized protein
VIPAETEAEILRVIEEVRQKSGGEIVVVTLRSLEGRTRDEVALQLGREWGVGQAGEPGDAARNTGVIVLVVPRETAPDGQGQLKIELGYGANTFITAAEAGRIADNLMMPAFRQQDYGTGILRAVDALALQFAERFGFELTGEVAARAREPAPGGDGGFPSLVLWLLVLFIVLSAMGRGGRGRRRRRGCLPLLIPVGMGRGPRGGRG